MPPPVRLTDRASRELARLTEAGHSVAWGRGSDGRATFYWARLTPAGTSATRVARATDVDSLMDKAALLVTAGDHLIQGFSDPLRYCPECSVELSFDADGPVVFACPVSIGHLEVRPV